MALLVLLLIKNIISVKQKQTKNTNLFIFLSGLQNR